METTPREKAPFERPGRPPKVESDKLSKQHPLKLTAAEKEEFSSFSSKLSLTIAAFLRMACHFYVSNPPAVPAKPKTARPKHGEASTRGRGAPLKPEEEKCNVPSPIVMTVEDHAAFTRFAKERRMTLSGFIRTAGHHFIAKHAGERG